MEITSRDEIQVPIQIKAAMVKILLKDGQSLLNI